VVGAPGSGFVGRGDGRVVPGFSGFTGCVPGAPGSGFVGLGVGRVVPGFSGFTGCVEGWPGFVSGLVGRVGLVVPGFVG